MRVFSLVREFVLINKELAEKLSKLEEKYNYQFKDVYGSINYLTNVRMQQIDFDKRERIVFKK